MVPRIGRRRRHSRLAKADLSFLLGIVVRLFLRNNDSRIEYPDYLFDRVKLAAAAGALVSVSLFTAALRSM